MLLPNDLNSKFASSEKYLLNRLLSHCWSPGKDRMPAFGAAPPPPYPLFPVTAEGADSDTDFPHPTFRERYRRAASLRRERPLTL